MTQLNDLAVWEQMQRPPKAFARGGVINAPRVFEHDPFLATPEYPGARDLAEVHVPLPTEVRVDCCPGDVEGFQRVLSQPEARAAIRRLIVNAGR